MANSRKKTLIKRVKTNTLSHSEQTKVCRRFLYYGSYPSLVFICHYVLVSLVAFFHFSLNHRFQTIEDWIFRKGWEIIILCKVLSLIFYIKIFDPEYFENKRKSFLSNLHWPSKEILVAIVYWFLMIFWLGQPTYDAHSLYSLSYQLMAWVGLIIFYLSDLIVLIYLRETFTLSSIPIKVGYSILVSLCFYGASKFTFPYQKNVDFFLFLNMLTCLFLLELKKDHLICALVYIVLFLAPLGALLGLDPVWGQGYSLFKMGQKLSSFWLSVVWLVPCAYLYFTNTPKNDHIN